MPLKKKNKLKNKIIFWFIVTSITILMIYVPKAPIDPTIVEHELY